MFQANFVTMKFLYKTCVAKSIMEEVGRKFRSKAALGAVADSQECPETGS
jgi:hypothetical protein